MFCYCLVIFRRQRLCDLYYFFGVKAKHETHTSVEKQNEFIKQYKLKRCSTKTVENIVDSSS